MHVYACAQMKKWRFKTVPNETKNSIYYSHQDNTNILTHAQSVLLN